MHLPQIAALPKVADDLTESGRAAHLASEGEGFLSVFSGGAAAAVPEASGSEPPAVIPSARVAFAEFAQAPAAETPAGETPAGERPAQEKPAEETPRKGAPGSEPPGVATAGVETPGAETPGAETPGAETPGAETLGTAAPQDGALRAPADRVPEPTKSRQPPIVDARARVPDEGGGADGQSTGEHAAELASDAIADIAHPDDWLLPGIPVPATAPGGATPGRAPEAFAQENIPVRSSPDKANGGRLTTIGADAGEDAVSENIAPARRTLHTPVPGIERTAQSLPTTAPDFVGSAARSGALLVDPDMRGPAQVAGATPQAGTAVPDGQGRPDGIAGERGADFRSADPTAPTAARLDGVGAVQLAGNGQTATAATGMQMPTGIQGVPPEARGPRAEARSAAETVVPASQGASQADMSTMQASATAAPPAGSAVEAAVAASGGGSGVPGVGEGLFNADPTMSENALGEARGPVRGPSAATLPVFQSADTPRLVALQIAEVVRASGERAVELRLQPEELGRVQVTMSQDATGTLTVSLNVERAETLDLLRRNIDLLGADLRELGYESIDFSFQGDGTGAQQDARPDRGDGQGALDADAASTSGTLPQTGVRGALASGDGIDIRL